MIIKIMPENEFEKDKVQEVEHTGVKEFLIFGNKKDNEGDLVDFFDWSGSYRYLEGSLYYFLTTITEEKKSKSRKTNEISLRPQAQNKPPFIKKGQVEDPNVQVIDAEELSKKANGDQKERVIEFPSDSPNAEVIETPVNDDNMEAEDKD